MIYQTHPSHGRHIAYNGLEAEANRKSGWKDVTKAEFYGEKKVVVQPTVETVADAVYESAAAEYWARFGKKPHHRMNTESILKALDANGE